MDKYMHKQPIINIGVIGHVSDGKSTIVKRLTGTKTQKHSKERERNITMRLGYANAKIAKCDECMPPECYESFASSDEEYICKHCGEPMKLVTHVSFVDAPGHNMLMEVMLNGTCAMDYTMLVESVANTTIPAPQTVEHLLATEMIGTPNAVVCMNKLDLVDKTTALTNISKLKKFLTHASARSSPLVPISATFDINIDVLCEIIAKLPMPERELSDALKMIVIRSFNINMPGIEISSIKGGVIGGSILKGTLKIGDVVTIYPGYKYKNKTKSGKSVWSYKPSECIVQSIYSDKTSLMEAVPGGLIGVQLDIDPSLTADDAMVGQIVLNKKDLKGSVYEIVIVNTYLIDELRRNETIHVDDVLAININANNIDGKVIKIESTTYTLELCKPVYIEMNDQITLSKKKKDGVYVMAIGKFIGGVESTQI